jgi:hypothetical protein
MSDKYYQTSDTTTALRSWVLWQMLRGMAWAAAIVFAIGLMLVGIWAVGQLLPPESKTAPSPYGMMQAAPQSALV